MKKLVLLGLVGFTFMFTPFIALLAVVGVASTNIACPPEAGGPLSPTAPIPDYARPWIALAHQACPVLPATYLAALMAQETNFHPASFAMDKNGGTWGLFQINASIWRNAYGAPWDADLNFNGIWDIKEPLIHSAIGGKYLCARYAGVLKIRANHPGWRSTTDLSELDGLVIAHNAGEGRLRSYPRIPAITARYIRDVRAHVAAWSASEPPLTQAASPSADPTPVASEGPCG